MPYETQTTERWWMNATIYCLDVETFADGNGDGIGDFTGATGRLSYLSNLGITTLWLMPFYPSPQRDDGYDVADFMAVDPRFGSLGDFVLFVRAARDRGLRVIIDLVVNHTSDRHPWFESARSDRSSPRRDWYIWSDEPVHAAKEIVFPGEQKSNWTYDETTGQYYFHRFMPHQPDLNFANPVVREEVMKIIGSWLQLGVSGLRIDAAPFLIETVGVHGAAREKHHEWLAEFRSFVSGWSSEAVLVGEANVPEEEVADFFGDCDELHMLFNFALSAGLVHALATESAQPLRDQLSQLPSPPQGCAWLNFVRLHDELNLDRLSEEDQAEVFAAFAPDEEMRLFGRGLRGRLAPMVHGDQRRLALAYSMVFALPGTPMLFYGEEIGMGDNRDLPARLAVRTPMQWAAGESGGFSTAPPDRLVRPLVHDPNYAPAAVNVTHQRRQPGSLLNRVRRIMEARLETPSIGLGNFEALDSGDGAVFAHRSVWEDECLLALHNFSAQERQVAVPDLAGFPRSAVVLADTDGPDLEDSPETIRLGPYGYCWIRATKDSSRALL